MKGCTYPDCKEEEESLPFKCKLCEQYYCGKHRLPEQHDCPRISIYQSEEYKKAKAAPFKPKVEIDEKKRKKEDRKKYHTPQDIEQKSIQLESQDRFLTRSSLFSIFAFRKNVYNVLFATFYISIIVTLNSMVDLTLYSKIPLSVEFLWTLLTIFVSIIIIYGGHLVLQNYFAKVQNIRSGNVIWKQGLLIGLFGIIAPIMLIPSYLVFRDVESDSKQKGITALSGIVWILFWQVFIIFALVFQFYPPYVLFGLSIIPFFMLFFVMFSLIPFGISNGKYISMWNRKLVWGLLAITVAIFITYLVLFRGSVL